ncbi:MAG: PAS domain-containing protein, partial [Planctomycetales bacterium]
MLHNAWEPSAEAVCVLDAGGEILSSNPAWARLLGPDDDNNNNNEFGGRLRRLFSEEDFRETVGPFLELLQAGEDAPRAATTLLSCSGETYSVELSGTPLTDPSGASAGWMLIARQVPPTDSTEPSDAGSSATPRDDVEEHLFAGSRDSLFKIVADNSP